MGKVIKLTESELKRLIENIIQEQNLAMGQNYQQGKDMRVGEFQQKRQAVNTAVKQGAQAVGNAAKQAANMGKQVIVTIGKVTFTVITYGAAVVFLIGKGLYKVSAAVGNSILKFVSAVGGATVSAATALGQSTISGLKVAGIAMEKGGDFVGQQLVNLKDSTVAIAKWVVGLFKGLGAAAYAKALVGANSIKELGSAMGNWLQGQYNTVANALGASWDEAKGLAQKGLSNLKAGAKSAYDTVSKTATNFANKASNYAGQAVGAIQGFLSEFFNRLLSMENKSTNTLLSEMVNYNGKTIL